MRTLTPIGPRVVIKRKQAPTHSGAIILVEESKEKPAEGEVIAVGCGYRQENGSVTPLDVMIGDKVLFSKYSGSEVDLNDDNEYLIMEESNILGILYD